MIVFFSFNFRLTTPSMAERPTPNVPKDDLLAHLLMKFPHMVYKYHEHDSLLESKSEEELSEQEKNDAWAAYEADVKRKNESNLGPYNAFGMGANYPGFGSYQNSLFNNYNNFSGVNGLNYPYNMYNQYNPYDNNQWRFNDYSAFYNNLMNVTGTSMNNYNASNSSLISPNHSSSVSSPPPINYTSSRNWMQSNASSSNYANNFLSSLTQSPASSPSNLQSYLNSLYNALGTNTPAQANAGASTSKTPPLPSDFNALAYLQKQQMASVGGANQMAGSSSGQQGPNALRNPLLTKELTLPRNPTMTSPKDIFNSPTATSVITKSAPSPSSAANQSEANKSSSKGAENNISSTAEKTTKSPSEPLITVKNVTTINNESRESPDTTAPRPPAKKTTDKSTVSNGISSTFSSDSSKKSNNKQAGSTNMGIVYPPQKTTSNATTSKGAPSPTIVVPSSKNGK